jgi:hypothetical protein
MSLSIQEQVNQAILIIKDQFKHSDPIPPIPFDLTLEELWVMYNDKKTKAKHKAPTVEAAVKLLLEDPELCEIPVADIAEIIKQVFNAYGIKCKCSESSVRWYKSQRCMEWDIVKRQTPKWEAANVKE